VLHSDAASVATSVSLNKLDEPEKKTRINQTASEINQTHKKTKHNDESMQMATLFYKNSHDYLH